MAFRFSDNILNNIEGSDFVVRKRVPRSMFVLIVFLSAFDFICFSAYLTDDTTVNGMFLTTLLLSISALAAATFFFINRFRKLILVTEFQTAMLASATQIGTKFCFIVNGEGTIFYVDPGFQKTFSGFADTGNRTFRELLAFIDVSEEQKQKMYNALKHGKSDNMVLSFHNPEGKTITLMTTIDVIPRPKGYFIIRGRDYVEKRSESKVDDNLPLLLEKTICALSGLLLVADVNGKIVGISEEFEQLLGYGRGEVAEARLQVKQVLHQYGGNEAGVVLLEHYSGSVAVRKKDQALINAHIQQVLLVASNNKTLGISAVITL